MAAANTNRASYDHVLLLDLMPLSGFPHVSAVSYKYSGIPEDMLQNLKVTKELRLEPRRLPIYVTPHLYHIVAKIDKDCDTEERRRAATAVNDFLNNDLRAGLSLDQAVERIVDHFPARVLRRQAYLPKNAVGEKKSYFAMTSRFRKRPAISSDEVDSDANKENPGTKKQRSAAPKSPPPPQITAPTKSASPPPTRTNVTINNSGLVPLFFETPNDDQCPEVPDATAADENTLQTTAAAGGDSPLVEPPPEVNNNQDPVANCSFNSASTHTPTPQTRKQGKLTNDKFNKLLERMDVIDKKEDRRYDLYAGSMKFLTDGMDEVKADLLHLKNAVKQLTAQQIQNRVQMLDSYKFPCSTEEEIDELEASEGRLQQLFERQVYRLIDLLHSLTQSVLAFYSPLSIDFPKLTSTTRTQRT